MSGTSAWKSRLRAGIFAGTVGLLPAVAFADTGAEATAASERIDHQTAEAKGAGAVTGSSAANDAAPRVPDHAAAEARGASADAGLAGNDMTAGVPDHAEAQARTPAPAPSNP